jgi:tetratricopeptide (TPR) repeat protein
LPEGQGRGQRWRFGEEGTVKIGSNKHDDTDDKIDELKSRQPSPDNLNLLGDLYLKKGDKKAALDCFYRAAQSSHRDKAIAVYKKILRSSSSETRAHEALITIYSQTGLTAEIIRHLMALARLYQRMGDTAKETATYRRIHELDPENKAVELFFNRGKADFEEIPHLEESPEVPAERLPEEAPAVDDILEEGTQTGLPRWKKALLPSAAAVVILILLAAGIVFYQSKKGVKRSAEPQGPKPSSVPEENRAAAITRNVQGSAFAVEATRLTGDLLKKLPISAKLTEKDLSENTFYRITVKATKGCVPEKLVESPYQGTSLLDRDGKPFSVPRSDINALDSFKKVIYRPYACGGQKDIIYAQFYLAYPGTLRHEGLLLDGVKILFEKKAADVYTSRVKG